MKRRALQTVLRLRRLAVDAAKRELADRLADESEAAALEEAAEAAIRLEAEVATSLYADDSAVEAFAAWLPRGRAALDQARRRREEAELSVTRARAALRIARADQAAVQQVLAAHDAARLAETARRGQAALDEAALECHRRRDDD